MDDDLFSSLRGDSSDDDPLASLSGEPEPAAAPDDPFAALDDAADDPFASLDAVDDSDPFAALAATPEPAAPAPAPAPPEPTGVASTAQGEERPEWLRELGGFEESQDPRRAAGIPSPARGGGGGASALLQNFMGRGPHGIAMGMTAQQRMVLSIFLFLDVAAIGCMLLIAIGAVQL